MKLHPMAERFVERRLEAADRARRRTFAAVWLALGCCLGWLLLISAVR